MDYEKVVKAALEGKESAFTHFMNQRSGICIILR